MGTYSIAPLLGLSVYRKTYPNYSFIVLHPPYLNIMVFAFLLKKKPKTNKNTHTVGPTGRKLFSELALIPT